MRETNNAYDWRKQQSKFFARNLIQSIILQNRREKQANVDTHNPRLLRFSDVISNTLMLVVWNGDISYS